MYLFLIACPTDLVVIKPFCNVVPTFISFPSYYNDVLAKYAKNRYDYHACIHVFVGIQQCPAEVMDAAQQIKQNTSKADEENNDIKESLKLETSDEQIPNFIRSWTEKQIHQEHYEEHKEHLKVKTSAEELSGIGYPGIKTEVTFDTLSRTINKNEIVSDMDHKIDENVSEEAKFKPINELIGNSCDEPKNNNEAFIEHKQIYDSNMNGRTFQQSNNDNRSLRRSSRNAGKRVCYEEDISEFEVFEEPTNDFDDLEDRFLQFSRKELKIEIESIRQACDKIAQQDKVLVNERKRNWQPDKAISPNIQLKSPIKANIKLHIPKQNSMSDLEIKRWQFIRQPKKQIEPHLKLQDAKERNSFQHHIQPEDPNMKVGKEMNMSDIEKKRNQYIWQPNKEIEAHIKLQLAKERNSFKHQMKPVHQNLKISKETEECNVEIEKEKNKIDMTKTKDSNVKIDKEMDMSDIEKKRNQYIWQPKKEIEPCVKLEIAKERKSYKHHIKSVDQHVKISEEMQELNVDIEKGRNEKVWNPEKPVEQWTKTIPETRTSFHGRQEKVGHQTFISETKTSCPSDITKTISRENDMHSEKADMHNRSGKRYKVNTENKSVDFPRNKNDDREIETEVEMKITSYEEDLKLPDSVQDFGQYSTSEPFTMHRRRNAGEHIPDFRCIICELEFDFMDDMNYHMALYHKMKCIRKSFSCSKCVDDIPDWFQMSIDRDQGENKPGESQDEAASATYSCKICSHTCTNIELLHKHIHSNHHFDFECIKTVCSYCRSQLSETIYEVCTLIKDLCPRRGNPIIHPDAKSHLCKICNVPCKDKAEVNLHRKLHLRRKGSYECLKCDKTFRKWNYLEHHVWMHYDKTPFRCRYCAKYKTSGYGVYLHELHHLPESQKKFECNQCEFRSWTKGRLTSHIKNAHSNKRYNCNLCPATYKSKPGLLHHKMKKHNGQFRFTCDICGAGAVTQQHLNRHKESHENIHCPVCNKKLFRRRHLSLHMKNVHGKRERLPCDQCGKMFATSISLAAHYTLHTGEKKFKCPQCDKRFRTPGGLDIHKRHHSGIKEHACTYCEKAFTHLQIYKTTFVYTQEKNHLNVWFVKRHLLNLVT